MAFSFPCARQAQLAEWGAGRGDPRGDRGSEGPGLPKTARLLLGDPGAAPASGALHGCVGGGGGWRVGG